MRSRGVLWCTAVLIAAAGLGCSGDDENGGPGDPTLDGSTWNTDGGLIDVMTDTDGDGVSDFLERASGDTDLDGDGIPNYRDDDDDGDGIATRLEREFDSDNDGTMNYLDVDDDNDGKLTRAELAGASPSKDTDGDGVPDYLDDDRLAQVDGGVEKECAQSSAKADLTKKPVDIVFVIDNSSSMDSEIQAVQHSINADFARIIGTSGIDYRVIMLADFGHYKASSDRDIARSVCISGELNPGQTCPSTADAAVYGQAPVNSARYYHYDANGSSHAKGTVVDSFNSLCKVLDWFKRPDGFGLAPQGWSQWLRKDAQKVFVEITDDRADCTVNLGGSVGMVDIDDANGNAAMAGSRFDAALRALSPEQFGSEAARNYVFHSIISMPFKSTRDAPYEASEPIAARDCASGENPGRGYEVMSRMTGGLRFPICAADPEAGGSTEGFTNVFKRIAQGVVAGSKVQCVFDMPAEPPGKTLDRETIEVVYTPASGDPVSFRRVQDTESCGGQNASFFFVNDKIALCNDTCGRVQADNTAKVDVRFGCKLPPRDNPPPPQPQAPE